eukprot:TRINITY_DN20092_c0_g1_i4.p1 TRINITY_DN20092_c0_g1~~TRINITY_DN20092_c0_g1_i4.p1  ORF type:complete len:170 (+),score=15.27 TRINITY_DN20092_c0_g1_i4:108-617(+)
MTDQGALQQWFRTVDSDNSGQVTSIELARALAMGNLNFSLAVTAQMIRIYDKKGSGTIGFNEFVELHKFLVQMVQCYKYYDKNNDGTLSADEVFHALQNAGFTLEHRAFQTLVKTFDPDNNNKIGLSEFIAMTLFLKGASAVFQAFDPQQQGYIQLDYNQFIYAAANCR